ncbi:MAG: enoyl-CoA hydratase/isomerase family protein [Chloroflexi bacterium]|nr:enoyl-CoA hydratase/isomerase family protein [Chloroflexota bacterium]
MPDYRYATYEKKGHVGYVTVNRPEVMNALHAPANHELYEIWADFEQDPEMWIGVLTGAGERAFSAGNDLKATAEAAARGERFGIGPLGGFGGLTNPRFRIWKPIIAAVNGYALGGGLEMALACDIVIAAENAQLGLPEPKRGLIAGAGGILRLPRMIPQKIAMGYILTGKFMTAQEAHRWGLVNEVVPAKDLMGTVERWIEEIMECAPLSVRASKQGAMEGLDMPLPVAFNHNFYWAQRSADSPDRIEGPKAFAEKRKPQWSGR